jgi:hypothetical protein
MLAPGALPQPPPLLYLTPRLTSPHLTSPRLACTPQAIAYRRVALPEGALQGEALHRHYQDLILKYTGGEQLHW